MASDTLPADPRSAAPHGLCDTHMHIYEPGYPTVAGTRAPARGTLENYRALCARLGIARSVIVQPTAYGFDNRCTLDAMEKLGADAARGVAVVDQGVGDEALREMTKAGMRGLRLAMIPGGAISWDDADALVRRVQAVGWHTQLQLDGAQLPARATQVLGWPGDIVIDHIGRFPPGVTADDPAVGCLLRLLETGRVWLKLSAPYWSSQVGAPGYGDVEPLVRAFVAAAPERMLWATNWPHPSMDALPDDAAIRDRMMQWLPDEAVRRKVLADNAARLYGF